MRTVALHPGLDLPLAIDAALAVLLVGALATGLVAYDAYHAYENFLDGGERR